MAKGFVRGSKASNNGTSKGSKPAKKGLQKVGVGGNAKVECPIDYDHFVDNATPLVLSIEGQDVNVTSRSGEELGFTLTPVEFSTDSLGYSLNGFATLNIGGEEVPVTVDFKFVVVGSKKLDRPRS